MAHDVGAKRVPKRQASCLTAGLDDFHSWLQLCSGIRCGKPSQCECSCSEGHSFHLHLLSMSKRGLFVILAEHWTTASMKYVVCRIYGRSWCYKLKLSPSATEVVVCANVQYWDYAWHATAAKVEWEEGRRATSSSWHTSDGTSSMGRT